MSETIFDKIIRQQLPAEIVYEDEAVLAFRDISPQAPIHVLVIPRQKVEHLEAFAKEDAATVGRFFQKVAAIAQKLGLSTTGYRVVLNQGNHGGQTVAYLHAHILGGREMQWPPG